MKTIKINSKNKLLNILKQEMKNREYVIIQSGHFALIHDNDDKLIPGIYSEIKNKKLKQKIKENKYMGIFPINTFKLGVDLYLIAKKNNIKSKIFFLVNDWQWVKPAEFGQENGYRKQYYKNIMMPITYKKYLNKNKIDENQLLNLKNINNKRICAFFSETKLRNQYDNHYRYTCYLKNKCAQEQIPMFTQIKKENADLFINFIPKTCKDPTVIATEEFIKNNTVKIINIFISGSKNDKEIEVIL